MLLSCNLFTIDIVKNKFFLYPYRSKMQSNIPFLRLFNSSVVKKFRNVSGIMFNKYLLLTNVGLSITLSAVGDILQQHYEIIKRQRESWDKQRTHHMSITGMTTGAICHTWYTYLDRVLPQRTFKVVIQKVIADQLVCSPACILAFFITLSCLEHEPWEVTKHELTDKGMRLYIAEWVVWPPAQIFNFYYLQNRYRVLYENAISLGYDVFTSYVRHDKPYHTPHEKDDVTDESNKHS